MARKKKEQQEVMIGETGQKKRSKLAIVTISLLVVAGLLFYFKGLFIAAIVEGQPISRLAVYKELEKQGGKQILDSLIVRALIKSEAKKKNIVVTDKEADLEVKKIEANFSKQGQKIEEFLAAQGMTRNDLKEQTSIQLILEKLLADKLKVSEKEVDDFLKSQASLNPSVTPQAPNREEIKQQLKQQKLQTEASNLIAKLRKNAKIYTFVNF